ncbi:MAG: type II toxin-antitoxin system RelE/ParE family toxin [Crocinitomicaceae bacterium]|jgi:toxin ParE1/3/4|nr:type II toxin-antitoxin system RelE/ParE family toxin [Crocinitomicaceae bacterium]
MLEVVKRPQAESDLVDLWLYGYGKWGAEQVDTYAYTLDRAIQKLPDNPKLGISIDEIRPGYRLLHVRSHLIIYRATNSIIDIVRVLSDAMDIPRHI